MQWRLLRKELRILYHLTQVSTTWNGSRSHFRFVTSVSEVIPGMLGKHHLIYTGTIFGVLYVINSLLSSCVNEDNAAALEDHKTNVPLHAEPG